MIRSSSEFRSNLVYGNSYDFGVMSDCLNTNHESGDADIGVIKGKLCFVQYYSASKDLISVPPMKSYFNLGWKEINVRAGGTLCIPLTCPASVVAKLMQQTFNETNLTLATDYNQEEVCKSNKWKPLRVFDILAA